MSWQGLLLVAGPVVPLGLCVGMLVRRLRYLIAALLPLAPLPALAAAMLLPAGHGQPLPAALLGAGLAVTPAGRIFLGVAAVLWSLAAVHARTSVNDRTHSFASWWLATLGGNMLLFVAADVVTFYFAFALVSLGAFGLVVHTRTAQAMRAGRVYLVLAIVGESSLLLGLMLGAHAAGTTLLTEVAQALAQTPERDLALTLLVLAFGIKAGLMPVHVWLPLAHPVAPPAASAVLSGAIVKAGIFGMLAFLPLGADPGAWSSVLIASGMATAFGGALLGTFQARAKTVLAYSTLSQMGLLVAMLGAGLRSPEPDSIVAAVALYAAHHSLAKGSLFLSVGVAAQASGRHRKIVMAATVLLAFSIAGLPFTSGALAKLSLKSALGDDALTLLLTVSGITTTLVMLRFLQVVRQAESRAEKGISRSEAISFAAVALAALVLPAMVRAHQAALTAPGLADAWATLWPVLLGVGLFLAGRALLPARWSGRVPEGDLVVPALCVYRGAWTLAGRLRWPAWHGGRWRHALFSRRALPADWPGEWRTASLLFLALVGLMILMR